MVDSNYLNRSFLRREFQAQVPDSGNWIDVGWVRLTARPVFGYGHQTKIVAATESGLVEYRSIADQVPEAVRESFDWTA